MCLKWANLQNANKIWDPWLHSNTVSLQDNCAFQLHFPETVRLYGTSQDKTGISSPSFLLASGPYIQSTGGKAWWASIHWLLWNRDQHLKSLNGDGWWGRNARVTQVPVGKVELDRRCQWWMSEPFLWSTTSSHPPSPQQSDRQFHGSAEEEKEEEEVAS